MSGAVEQLPLRDRALGLAVAGVTGALAMGAILARVLSTASAGARVAGFLAALAVSAVAARGVWRPIAQLLQGVGWRWVCCALLAGALFPVLLPTPPATLPQQHELEIVALGPSAEGAGAEVWLASALGSDAQTLSFTGKWESPAGAWLLRPGDVLKWRGTAAPVRLGFGKHAWSGRVGVRWDGEQHEYDLHSTTGSSREILLGEDVPLTPMGWLWRGWGHAGDGLLFALLLLLAVRWGTSHRLETIPAIPRRLDWVFFGLPSLVVWTVYLLAAWPGVMTPDSIDQWRQMTEWTYVNNHPAAHTLTNWVLTRPWESPAMVAGTQIVVLASTVGLCLVELRRWGLGIRGAWVLAILIAVLPANGWMVITLWKDIPYAVAFLALFSILLRVVRTGGAWLQGPRNIAALAIALAGVALYRHNGTPVAAVTLLILIFGLPKVSRAGAWKAAAAVVLIVGMVRGPVYRWADVKPVTPYFAAQLQVHQLAAIVREGTLTADQTALLQRIQPLESWTGNYLCFSLNPTVWAPEVRSAPWSENPRPFLELWFELARSHPRVIWDHHRCVTEPVWRILDVRNKRLPYTTGIFENEIGLVTRSSLPNVRASLDRFALWSRDPSRSWFFWGMASATYFAFFAVAVGIQRSRNGLLALAIAPTVLHWGALLVLMPSPDFRFMYPVFLVALVSSGLFVARRPAAGAPDRGQATLPVRV